MILLSALAAWTFAAGPVAAPLAQRLAELPSVGPLEQVRRLQDMAVESPAGRAAAAAVAQPELFLSNRTELEKRLGVEPAQQLQLVAAALQIDARSDANLATALEQLSRAGETKEGFEPVDLSSWFDGTAATLAPQSRLVVWPENDAAGSKRRLQALSIKNGRFVVNGKTADTILAQHSEDGLLSQTLVLPTNKDFVVRLFHSPSSLDAFDRQRVKLDRLRPLSRAGLAAPLVEYGEASVPGMGRVYFLVQERAEGRKLADLPVTSNPLGAVKDLLNKAAEQGLLLRVPVEQAWLLANVAVGKRAWLLDGAVEKASPEEIAGYHETLLALAKDWLDRRPKTSDATAPKPLLADGPLFALLSTIPESSARDALLARIPGALYGDMKSAEIVALLSLVSAKPSETAYDRLPSEAWAGLKKKDLAALLGRRMTQGPRSAAREIARLWLHAHPDETPAVLEPELRDLVQQVSPEIAAIFTSELTPQAQLEAIRKFVEGPAFLNAEDLIHLLENMPKGVKWGWEDADNVNRFFREMRDAGVPNNWGVGLTPFDYVLAGRAIAKTKDDPQAAKTLERLPSLIKQILDHAHGFATSKQEYKIQVERYLFELTRQLNERVRAAK